MSRAFERTISIQGDMELSVLTYSAGHGPVGTVQLATCHTQTLDIELIEISPRQARQLAWALHQAAEAAQAEAAHLTTSQRAA